VLTGAHQPKLVIVSNENDWEGLYVDGQLICENHSLSVHDIARAADLNLSVVYVNEWLGEQVSSLPLKLADIPKSAIQA
jgi:hypothetical protein